MPEELSRSETLPCGDMDAYLRTFRAKKAERNVRQQEGKNVNRGSVVDMQMVEFKGQRAITRPYLDDFPFSFYLIVRELNTLPKVLADAMQQWF